MCNDMKLLNKANHQGETFEMARIYKSLPKHNKQLMRFISMLEKGCDNANQRLAEMKMLVENKLV